MPLLLSALDSGLEAVASAPPDTSAECAQDWADAVQAWASAVLPASTTVAAAASTLATALAAAFATGDAAAAMETAFAAFAATVGGGMVGYTPTPPAGQVGFAAQFAGPKPATHADAATAVAGLIDEWMKTGSSTLIASPFTVVPWS